VILQAKKRKMMTRSVIAAAVFGAIVGSGLAGAILVARAQTSSSAVAMHNFTFTPQTLTVKTGTTVTWTNKDDTPHGVASANNAFKKSQALDSDDNYSFTFATPGTYAYFCFVHPFMKGTIVVEAASGKP
jgi:amicyanin